MCSTAGVEPRECAGWGAATAPRGDSGLEIRVGRGKSRRSGAAVGLGRAARGVARVEGGASRVSVRSRFVWNKVVPFRSGKSSATQQF